MKKIFFFLVLVFVFVAQAQAQVQVEKKNTNEVSTAFKDSVLSGKQEVYYTGRYNKQLQKSISFYVGAGGGALVYDKEFGATAKVLGGMNLNRFLLELQGFYSKDKLDRYGCQLMLGWKLWDGKKNELSLLGGAGYHLNSTKVEGDSIFSKNSQFGGEIAIRYGHSLGNSPLKFFLETSCQLSPNIKKSAYDGEKHRQKQKIIAIPKIEMGFVYVF